ncbi:hypothetical protein P3T27_005765 [Kitasatospora sp. MAA19]|nr:hypothetical protein [Kitasatospora sp. MAA19]
MSERTIDRGVSIDRGGSLVRGVSREATAECGERSEVGA